MATREYYTVDRSPQEVRNLWDWANEEYGVNKNPYAMGVLAAMVYLMGEAENLPQDCKGRFCPGNASQRAKQPSHKTGRMLHEDVNDFADCGLKSGLSSNSKPFLDGASLGLGDVVSSQGFVNDGDEAFRRNTDSWGGQS